MTSVYPPYPSKSPMPAEPPASAPRKLNTTELFAGQREVVIVHHGEEYRLRITRQEKLILTK
ncbi:MAG: hemin uptake protein HemP [Rhodoferax sp.]|nr:hemin uptake protein HemP [Rhodoferax sp.]